MATAWREIQAQEWLFGRVWRGTDSFRFPADWDLERLADIARLESGHTPSRKEPSYWDGDVPWISLHDSKKLDSAELSQTSQTISPTGLANSSARLLPAGTVVFSRTATVGKCTIMGREMSTSQDFANYVCGPRLHNKYLMHLFRHLAPEWKRLMAGSTHNTVYMPIFRDLMVLVPPLEEQRKIAAILGSVDEAIERTQAVIDQVQVVKQALMQQLLTRGLPGRHTRFKQTELGEIPESWELLRGDELFTLHGGYGPSSIDFDDGTERDCLFIKVSMFSEPGNERTITSSSLKFSSSQNARIQTYENGLVFPKRGAAIYKNRVRLLSVPTAVDPNLMVLCSTRDDDTRYLRYMMLHIGLSNLSDNSGIPQLNNKHLYPALFWVPPRDEQVLIADAIESLDNRVLAEHEMTAALQALKQSLMSVLLTGELRVTP